MKSDLKKLYDYHNKNNSLDEMFSIIDFLLYDNKFNGWSKGKKQKLSRSINNYFNENGIRYKYNLSTDEIGLISKRIHIGIGNGSNCEMLFKGIRNGLVHLNFKVNSMQLQKKKYYCIEINDISAKIKIPVDFVGKIYKYYDNIKNNKSTINI